MKPVKALIVDDSKVMRLMVMKSLRQTRLARFSCDEAADGQDALEKFKQGDYEIVFVDINMPNMNGIEFVQHVRGGDDNPNIPIVMVTSEKTESKINEAVSEAGATDYICKPFTVDHLTEKLEDLIDDL